MRVIGRIKYIVSFKAFKITPDTLQTFKITGYCYYSGHSTLNKHCYYHKRAISLIDLIRFCNSQHHKSRKTFPMPQAKKSCRKQNVSSYMKDLWQVVPKRYLLNLNIFGKCYIGSNFPENYIFKISINIEQEKICVVRYYFGNTRWGKKPNKFSY